MLTSENINVKAERFQERAMRAQVARRRATNISASALPPPT